MAKISKIQFKSSGSFTIMEKQSTEPFALTIKPKEAKKK